MQRSRIVVLLWLVAGLAFLAAGFLADRRQPAFFAVAAILFNVSVIMSRRGSVRGPSAPRAR